MPIPDTARKLSARIDATHLREHIFSFLAFQLRGDQITEKDFSFERIDQYLLPFIKVIDEKGRVIEQGRDLSELKARCRTETHSPVKQLKGEFKTFPDNFVFEASQKVTGVVVKQYQVLVPTKDFAALEQKDESGVVIQTFNDQAEAIKQHRAGVIRLIHMQLGDLIRQLKNRFLNRWRWLILRWAIKHSWNRCWSMPPCRCQLMTCQSTLSNSKRCYLR